VPGKCTVPWAFIGLNALEPPEDRRRKTMSDAYCPLCLSDFKTWLQEPLIKRGSELDRLVQRPVQGAVHGVDAVRAFDCFLTASAPPGASPRECGE